MIRIPMVPARLIKISFALRVIILLLNLVLRSVFTAMPVSRNIRQSLGIRQCGAKEKSELSP